MGHVRGRPGQERVRLKAAGSQAQDAGPQGTLSCTGPRLSECAREGPFGQMLYPGEFSPHTVCAQNHSASVHPYTDPSSSRAGGPRAKGVTEPMHAQAHALQKEGHLQGLQCSECGQGSLLDDTTHLGGRVPNLAAVARFPIWKVGLTAGAQ